MVKSDPILLDLPMPIRKARLLLRPQRPGDGAASAAAVAESWDELHMWMAWAEEREFFTAETQEIRARQCMAKFILREELNLLGIEIATGEPVIWCGFHGMDWTYRQCGTGYWVRKSTQGRGFATESTHALLRYAFGPMGMRRVAIAHAEGNQASRRMIQKPGFTPEGVERGASPLPGGRVVDRHCYARLDADGLPPLDVQWG
jgi:RimJ/RimL family protein N-acetyltransferase